MGVIAEVDVSGRFVALITFFQATGIAIGPALVAPFLSDDNYDPVIWAGIVFAVIGLLLFLPITLNTKGTEYES
jgi:MFS family permease